MTYEYRDDRNSVGFRPTFTLRKINLKLKANGVCYVQGKTIRRGLTPSQHTLASYRLLATPDTHPGQPNTAMNREIEGPWNYGPGRVQCLMRPDPSLWLIDGVSLLDGHPAHRVWAQIIYPQKAEYPHHSSQSCIMLGYSLFPSSSDGQSQPIG